MRENRKKEHVENFFRANNQGDNLLKDVFLYHNGLPELNFSQIDTGVNFLGKRLGAPIIINAMTGGTDMSREINKKLSILANEFRLAMAVGSQTIAICDGSDDMCKSSFKIVRENMKKGLVIANLSANASLEDAKSAVELIDADGLQLHLNVAQEIVMDEGDRDFKGLLDNITNIRKKLGKPVIIKEVGFGLSASVVKKLYNRGIKYIDISGYGGTNFIEIEDIRHGEIDYSDLYDWGIPTALAIIEARKQAKDMTIIGSGGIRTSLDIAKSIAIGANLVGISGEILSYLSYGGIEGARKYLKDLIHKLKVIMLLQGVKNISELRRVDYGTVGYLDQLLEK